MSMPHNLAGQRFGRLIALRSEGKDRHGHWIWCCACDCGTSVSIVRGSLINRLTQSCGCLHRELLIERQTTHGMSQSSTFNIWADMRQRCQNPNDARYEDYGGRGITVCDRWEAFSNFLADMGERPEGLTLDRRDNSGPYEAKNCRWVSIDVQANNKRNNVIVIVNEVAMTVAQAARATGLKPNTIQRRLSLGWSARDAVCRPLRS